MTTPLGLPAEQNQLLRAAEEKYRTVVNAMELVLSLGDFQKQIDQPVEPGQFIQLAAARIDEIIQFDVSAIYFVDQETSALKLSLCRPDSLQNEMETQFEALIQQDYIAWALRETRWLLLYSKDNRYRVVLHAMATYSRIRGIFVGLFPAGAHRLPDGSLQALSLVLRNAANALESLEYMAMFQRQNAELHTKVDEKVGELRRRDDQLLNARKMDAIATLAGGVAHQYNNALAVLFGNLDLISMEMSNGQNIGKYLERIEAVAQKMQDLTSKLLAYAQGGKYRTQTVFIERLVEDVVAKMPEASQANAFEVRLPANRYAVHVDVTQMHLVLSAIVANASEALSSGGRIRISAEALTIPPSAQAPLLELVPGDYVVLQIRDDGQGMDAATLQHVFEPFFTTKFAGRGLSMAAAYGIVKNHHGAISVESEEGRGTTVRVYLPRASEIPDRDPLTK